MNYKNSTIIKIGFVIAIIFIVSIIAWIPIRNSEYTYFARYYENHLSFSGSYRGINLLEFNQVGILLKGLTEDCSTYLHVGDKKLKINDITMETMYEIEAKRIVWPFKKDWILYWPNEEDGQFHINFEFKDEELEYVMLTGEQKLDEECPFGISFNDGPEIIIPITLKELKPILGKPDSMDKMLHYP